MRILAGTLKLHSVDPGVLQSGIKVHRYPTGPACWITLPMDVVESSIKTILLKMRWIDLSSSAFTPYLYSVLLLP